MEKGKQRAVVYKVIASNGGREGITSNGGSEGIASEKKVRYLRITHKIDVPQGVRSPI